MGIVNRGKVFDWFLVILTNVMWATQVPVIRLIGDRLGAVAIAFVPLIISTIIFLPFLIAENKSRSVQWRWRWHDVKHFIAPGLIGVFVMQYAYTIGAQLTLAANAGIITLTIPVMVAIFASIMLKEPLNSVRIISFLLAIAGVMMTSVTDLKGADFTGNNFMTGNLIFLAACGCCAYYNTYCKMLVNKGYTELEILVYSSIVGCMLAVPFLIGIGGLDLSVFLQSDWQVLFGILELGTIVCGSSMLLFFYVLKRMDVTQAILGNYFLPFFIALLGVLILDETITPLMLTGGGLILVSTLMVTVYEDKLMSLFSSSSKEESNKPTNNNKLEINSNSNENY